MDITFNNTDELNAVIKIKVTNDDYQEGVTKALNDYRKKASIPGFRKGRVPMGHIKKLYGSAVLVDEVNKVISKSLTDYIVNEKLDILGEPLPEKTSEEQVIDWNKQTEFEFGFDIALAPKFEVKLSKREKLHYYTVEIDDELIEKSYDSYKKAYGKQVDVEKIEALNENVKCNLTQLNDKGEELENGISTENALIAVDVIKDEEIKKQFQDKKIGDVVTINIRKAFPNDTEISSLLNISKEEAKELNSSFKCEIVSMTKFEQAEINQELFDRLYGKDVVTSTEQFREKVIEELKKSFHADSEYKFSLDAKEKMLKKLEFSLPDEFLKRWLKAINKDLTIEQIEKDYSSYQEEIKWRLIVDKIVKDNEIKVEHDEILQFAKDATRQQFAQYGLRDIPEEQLEGYAKGILEKQEEVNKIAEKVLEDKVVNFIKESVKIEEKPLSLDEFNELFKN